MLKRRRKKMKPIITRKLNHKNFKITRELFKQAAALAKLKNTSIFQLLSDYLTIGVVSGVQHIIHVMGPESWKQYEEKSWNELNEVEKPLPRFKKRGIMETKQP